MNIAMGLVGLFFGTLILMIVFPRLLLGRGMSSYRSNIYIKMFVIAFLIISLAIYLIFYNQIQNVFSHFTGLLLIGVGVLVTVLGAWQSFWGPFSARNANKGLIYICLGVIMVMMGGFLLTTRLDQLASVEQFSSLNFKNGFDSFLNRKMGLIPYWLFSGITILLVNFISFKKRFRLKKIFINNGVIILMLFGFYYIAPFLFPYW